MDISAMMTGIAHGRSIVNAARWPVAAASLVVCSAIHSLRTTKARTHALLATTVAIAFTASIGSALATYPHTLSYFNELAGGPLNGPAHLLDANVDWGQDLLY